MRLFDEAGKTPEEIAEERIALALRADSTELNLSLLGLRHLPGSIGDLPQLTTLRLYSNRLTSLPDEIGNLTDLEWLDLNHNELACVPESLARLNQLQVLILGGNRLTALPDGIGRLTRLTHLYLDGNQLDCLPDGMRRMECLERLYLHGNDQLGLPAEVLGPTSQESAEKLPAAPAAILEYYFRTRKGARPLNETKLMVVGRGEVGKTCIVNRLVMDRFDSDTGKTAGIQISDWTLPHPHDRVRLHVWDFGGQEIMHATHRFFLTKRSVYLLVLNGRGGGEDEDVEYWLRLISGVGGDSPVLVVLNKIGEHRFDVNRRAVQEKYPQVRGFVQTDCKQNMGIESLRAAIADVVNDMAEVRTVFPAAWFAIKDQLAHMKEQIGCNYMAYPEYRALCSQSGENDPKAQDDLAGYLHCLGIALNYRDDPRLRETSLLSPHWVTNGIYRLLNALALADCQGQLQLSDLRRVLPAQDYPEEKHEFIVELMRKFQLCFAFQGTSDGGYLIPELLSKREPDLGDDFDPRQCLNFEYAYKALPEGLLPSFIVRSHVLSEGQHRWRSGVVLEWRGCRALVKADVPEKRITISVQGGTEAGRRELLAVIRSDFERIHREAQKPEVDEWVPTPEDPNVKLPYADLVGFEQDGIDCVPVRIGGKSQMLSVKGLLGRIDLVPPAPPDDTVTLRDEPGRLFICYSHKDEAYRERLDVHLKLLEHQRRLAPWSDRRLLSGDDWGGEVDRNLAEAHIIVFLVSADFIASTYCYGVEMQRAMRRWDNREACVVPVIIRPCDWQTAPFGKIQALPTDGKPVTEWANEDSAWADIARGIRDLAEALAVPQPPHLRRRQP